MTTISFVFTKSVCPVNMAISQPLDGNDLLIQTNIWGAAILDSAAANIQEAERVVRGTLQNVLACSGLVSSWGVSQSHPSRNLEKVSFAFTWVYLRETMHHIFRTVCPYTHSRHSDSNAFQSNFGGPSCIRT